MIDDTAIELESRGPLLLRDKAYIDGRWVDEDSRDSFDIENPATGKLLGSVPNMGAVETNRAILAADRALMKWRSRSAHERATILRRWHDAVLGNQEDPARIITGEQGKPLSESRVEVIYAASFIDWFAEEGKRVYGDMIPAEVEGRVVLAMKEPVGATTAITPWNFLVR